MAIENHKQYAVNFVFFIFIILSCSDVVRSGGIFSWLPLVYLIFILFISGRIGLNYNVIAATIFSFIIILNSFISADPLNTFARSIKVFLILVFAAGLHNSIISFRVVTGALLFLIFTNMLLIIFGLMGHNSLAFSGGGFRWETLLSRPGTLYIPALLFLSFFLSDGLLGTKYLSIKSNMIKIIWAFLSLILIVADGSRSAVLILIASLFVFIFFSKNSLKNSGALLFFASLFVVGYLNFSEYFDEKFSFGRFLDLVNSNDLTEADPTRVYLMSSAIDWIAENNPLLLGKGFSTTIVGENFELVVHNAYILVWEQLGLFAFLIFITIVFSPIIVLLRSYMIKKDLRLIMPLMCFVFFSFQLFLHPFATDYGPWIYYFLGYLFAGRFCVKRNLNFK